MIGDLTIVSGRNSSSVTIRGDDLGWAKVCVSVSKDGMPPCCSCKDVNVVADGVGGPECPFKVPAMEAYNSIFRENNTVCPGKTAWVTVISDFDFYDVEFSINPSSINLRGGYPTVEFDDNSTYSSYTIFADFVCPNGEYSGGSNIVVTETDDPRCDDPNWVPASIDLDLVAQTTKVTVSPNPSDGLFSVMINEPTGFSYDYQILDKTGNLIQVGNSALNEFDFDLTLEKPDIYILKIHSSAGWQESLQIQKQ